MKTREAKLAILFLVLFVTACGINDFPKLSLGENKYKLTSETELQEGAYLNKIEDFFDGSNYNYFYGVDSLKIAYKMFINTDGQNGIVISSGRTESIPKYKELIYDLYQNGFSVFILDHRGQGMSDRVYKKNPEVGYVDDFQFYVDDLKAFYKLVKETTEINKLFLLGHSMGGAISSLYIEQYPNDFTAVALSSPMLGLPFPTCEVVNLIGDSSSDYAPTQNGYKESIAYEENSLTTSEVRYNLLMKLQNENEQIRLGGASYRWIEESCKAMTSIFENADKIEIPLLLLQGSEETIVKPSAHNKFIDKLIEMNKPAKGYLIEGAKHELFIEKDEYRDASLNAILNFFVRYCK